MGNCITIKYIYSACVTIATPNATILCDPWFTEGIYDGSWYQYPKVSDPINSIGNVDYIYISHIHPDHYDPKFLMDYFKKFGVKTILIADHTFNHLKNKIISDGFNYKVLDKNLSIGSTQIDIYPHKTGSLSDIDSAILVSFHDGVKFHKVLNCNDIVFNDDFLFDLKRKVGDIDVLLLGYTGAGPYPQCYFDISDQQLIVEANQKKINFINRYLKNISIFQAKINIPFAGKYILAGKLSNLNEYRGIADPIEIVRYDKNAIILADNGGCIDTLNLKTSNPRILPYNKSDIENSINEIKDIKFSYENFISSNFKNQLPFEYLIKKSYLNAISKSEVENDYYICIHVRDKYHVINCNKNKNDFYVVNSKNTLPEPRSEYYLDPHHLFGLLTKVFHWNNAEVGSHLKVRRVPNIYNKKVLNFMNFFSV